ncbi:MAG: HDIG domain-containing protein [Bacteroidota bacterium]|nr:HDIG domain-containing protein [Bacteroidota bacterium]
MQPIALLHQFSDILLTPMKFSGYIRILSQRDNLFVKWGILVLLSLLTVLLFPSGEAIEADYRVGTIWTDKDLIAPFSFPIYKEEREYEQEREAAAKSVYRVFEEDASVSKNSIDSLQNFFERLQLVLAQEVMLNFKRRYHRASLSDIAADSAVVAEAVRSIPIGFTESEWNILMKLYLAGLHPSKKTPFMLQKLRRDVLLVVNQLYLQGIVDVRKSLFGADLNIAFRRKTDEEIVPLRRYLDQEELGRTVQQTFLSGYKRDNDTVSIATKIALSFLSPNIIFQKEQTEEEINAAMDAVPRTIGVVQQNERIIGKHERITDDIKLKLDSLRKAKAERSADINQFATLLGEFFHTFIVSLLLGIYLFLFRKKIYHDNAKILLIALIILLEAFFTYLTLTIDVDAPIEFLIVVPAGSMLLAIIFDSRVAFYGTVAMAFVVAGVRGNDYGLALTSLIAGSMALYTVRDIKHRTQIFRSITFIFIGYVVSIIALSLERYDSLLSILNQCLFAAANSVFSPVLTYGLLIFFERMFHVTTDLTLLELSDFNHPLLRELSQKAPGTFHHSVNMGTLAEAAAEAIGANAILARVGAYYHDVGKITKPAMFIENQQRAADKYDRLTPRVSANVIAAHVSDGVEMAREYGIPDAVLDFIPMHHGTTKISFFYDQAVKRRRKHEVINENDFRYPGPRPQTKETGIVMLADAVEASTRAIEEPTIQKIEEKIDAIIKTRFMEGELDECDLTLRDLTKIKSSFLKILGGIYHARIQYPEMEAPEIYPAPAETASEPPVVERRHHRRIKSNDVS